MEGSFLRGFLNKMGKLSIEISPFPGEIKREFVPRKFKTKTGKIGCQRVEAIVLDRAQKKWLRKWFPIAENSLLIEVSGLKLSTLHRNARELKLTKSDEGLKGIQKRATAKVKRTCRKNGYYASIRGKQPSPQCREAIRQMWQEVRDGKRQSPLAIMRDTSPRKFKRYLEKRSATRAENTRKETLRIIYGLTRKTNYNIVLRKYTRKQVNHRYNALQKDYFVMQDCSERSGERYNIYYDTHTKRSEKFEKNLVKDGFKVLQWKS